MKTNLPPSLDKRRHSGDAEVAYARSLTPEERLRLVARVCRSTLHALRIHSKPEVVLATRDPLPDSTVRALRRLRRTT